MAIYEATVTDKQEVKMVGEEMEELGGERLTTLFEEIRREYCQDCSRRGIDCNGPAALRRSSGALLQLIGVLPVEIGSEGCQLVERGGKIVI